MRTLYIGASEKIIGSRTGLFYVDEKNRRTKVFNISQLRSNIILCCTAYMGKYYIGTYGGGMYIFDPSDMSMHDFDSQVKNPFLNGHIFCMRTTPDGCLWLGTSSGVYCYQEGRLLFHYTMENSPLPGNDVFDIMFDSTGKGWIGTKGGLALWEPNGK